MRGRITLAAAVATLLFALPASAAQTPQQQATTFVCGATGMIKTDTQIIASDIVAPATPTSINAMGVVPPPYGSLQHIAAELVVIRGNLAALPPGFRLQATRASAAFAGALVPLARGLIAAPSGPALPIRLKLFTTSQTALALAYMKTLGTLKC